MTEKEQMKAEGYAQFTNAFTNFDNEELDLKWYVKKPTRVQLQRISAQTAGKKNPESLFQTFIISLLHESQKDQFAEMSEMYPGIISSLADEIFKRMGFDSAGK